MKKHTFKAAIQEGRGGGAFVAFPFDAEKLFGAKGRVPVNATIDGIAERTSLVRMGQPCHILGVPKAIRQRIDKGPGDIVTVAVWKDEAPREVDVPPQFKARLKQAGLLPFFEGLSFTHRKEYCRWIEEAKKEETRARRTERALEMLRQGVRTPD
jgi:hypothetical protein